MLDSIIANAIKALCVELKDLHAIPARRGRATNKEATARQVCTYLAKTYTFCSNETILRALGYKSDSKVFDATTGHYNVSIVRDRIITNDSLLVPVLEHVINLINTRQYKEVELSNITIRIIGNGTPTDEQTKVFESTGVYPFVFVVNNVKRYGYGIGRDGTYIGQSKEEYLRA